LEPARRAKDALLTGPRGARSCAVEAPDVALAISIDRPQMPARLR
jgi:hypothetical protein